MQFVGMHHISLVEFTFIDYKQMVHHRQKNCCCKSSLRPNQSLKLTEVAVDDFAARQYAKNDMISRYVRAMNYMEPAVRRRSLAPVR